MVVVDNNPIAVGYNGPASKEPHCLGNDCPGMVPGKCPAIHAEANALRKACQLLAPGSAVDLYTTHSPCEPCALLIVNCDLYIQRIFFEVPYRSTQHLGMFYDSYQSPLADKVMRKTGIYEVAPSGYITDYFTRQVIELP